MCIGLYPLVACLLNISTAVLDLHSEQNKLVRRVSLPTNFVKVDPN
jgi:hypothetical protein